MAFRRQRSSNYVSDAVGYFSNSASPQATFWAHKCGQNMTHRPYMGVGPGGQLIWGPPSTHLLSIGPPQGQVGKSGAFAATNADLHVGPEAIVTTKWDLVRSATLPRLRVGAGKPLWQYNPTGPTDPGFEQLRWSPLTECSTDTATAAIVEMLVDAAVARNRISGREADQSAHFAQLAKPLCHGLLRYANAHTDVNGRRFDMRWIGEQLQVKDYDALKRVANWLIEVNSSVWGAIAGFAEHGAGGREVHSIFTTAQIIFEPWMTDEAIASMVEPNFDPDTFVFGEHAGKVNEWLIDATLSDPTHPHYALARAGVLPGTGIFETVVIAIGHDQQQMAAPLIITFLNALTRAAVRLKTLDERSGHFGRPNLGLVLDELANLAPLPDLPRLLSEGASQGVTVYGCLQTASQSLQLWGEHNGGHAMLSNFGNVVLLPGVTDLYTLDWFERLAGEIDRQTNTNSRDFQGNISYSSGWERATRFPRDVLRSGHPQSPDLAMMVQGGTAMDWAYCTPVHRSRPWVPLLLETLEYLVWDENIAQRPAAALLPAPDLDRYGDGRFLTSDQRQRFYAALRKRSEVQDQLAEGVTV